MLNEGGNTVSFDIPQIHIADNSPEARVIEAIMNRDHVSPEEVVRRALRGLALEQSTRPFNAILAGRGFFSSPEDAAAIEAAVSLIYEERRQPSNRTASL